MTDYIFLNRDRYHTIWLFDSFEVKINSMIEVMRRQLEYTTLALIINNNPKHHV